jgi:hypothetical protein
MMQVTKVWWDGEKLMAEPIDPTTIYQEPAPVQVWQAEGYDALMKEMQMVKARNIRQHAEIERLSALVRTQQITIDKLEQALAAQPVQPVKPSLWEQYHAAQPAPVQELDYGDELTIAYMSGLQRGKDLAAQPAVPDAITDNSETPEYIQGWNDCRAEMLKGKK